MRIPDEQQLFQKGDEVFLVDGAPGKPPSSMVGIVESVLTSSIYYEHRPIASYTTYTYVVKINGEKIYLKADELMPAK